MRRSIIAAAGPAGVSRRATLVFGWALAWEFGFSALAALALARGAGRPRAG